MAAKIIISDVGATGLTIYAVVQNAAGNYYDNFDGTFKASPTTPSIVLTEDTLMKGRYANRNVGTLAVWPAGEYYSAIYRQTGVSPNLSADVLVGNGVISINGDSETSLSRLENDLAKEATSQTILTNVNTIILESANNVLKTLIKFNLFKYRGGALNTFSIVDGSFVGSIKFYSVSATNFMADSAHPPLTSQICTLNSNGTMTDTAGIATDGDILFFTLNNYNGLEDVIINYYCDYMKSNTRFYIPKGLLTVSTSIPYYPSVFGILLSNVDSDTYATPLTDGFINKNVANMSNIDWDRISSPIVIDQPTVLVTNATRMNIIRDRTVDLQFDLHRNIAGNTIYFAMKSDRKNGYYDVEPIACTITDSIRGLLSLTIPNTATRDLPISKYYGELFRLTATGKYQTLCLYDIDLINEIISSRDV